MDSAEAENARLRRWDDDREATFNLLQEQQQAWESFAVEAVRIIPALKAQMIAVIGETERAAMDLMLHLRILSTDNEGITADEQSGSLSKVVMAMQFQDMTRQKLEHVGVALDQLKQHLHALLKGPRDEEAKKEIAALQHIEHLYTMEAERRLHEAAIQPNYGEPVPIDRSGEDADSVTLF
ncbi:MAG: hypothetical protein JNN16_00605 [Nitrospira sp.]|nr:hypothetical protein [Nitrospira sp.]